MADNNKLNFGIFGTCGLFSCWLIKHAYDTSNLQYAQATTEISNQLASSEQTLIQQDQEHQDRLTHLKTTHDLEKLRSRQELEDNMLRHERLIRKMQITSKMLHIAQMQEAKRKQQQALATEQFDRRLYHIGSVILRGAYPDICI